jgi:hypothetical protein
LKRKGRIKSVSFLRRVVRVRGKQLRADKITSNDHIWKRRKTLGDLLGYLLGSASLN